MKNLLLFALLFSGFGLKAQNVVDWNASVEKINTDQYEITFTANIKDGWYVYSQYLDEGGPLPTTFEFEDGVKVADEEDEDGEIVKDYMDSTFEMQVKKFGGVATFKKIITLSSSNKIEGNLLFMACDDERCLRPQRKTFSFSPKDETFAWL